MAFDAVGATLWAGAYAGLGFIFWKQLNKVTTYIDRVGGLLSGLVLLLIAIILARRFVLWYRVFQELRFARIMPEELKQAMESGKPPVVLDVEGCAFHHPLHVQSIPGAIQIDGSKFAATEMFRYLQNGRAARLCFTAHVCTKLRVRA